MIVKSRLQLLGTAVVQGKKDVTRFYNTVSFLDGVQSVNVLTDDATLFSQVAQLPQLTVVDVEFNLELGRYTYCKLVSAVPVKA